MHTTQIGEYTVHHNGDFSGDVIITNIKEWGLVSPPDWPEDGVSIKIPFTVLEELVGIAKQLDAIARIEDVSGADYLNGMY